MTSRGPFQPKTFYDSMISKSFFCAWATEDNVIELTNIWIANKIYGIGKNTFNLVSVDTEHY